MKINTSRLVRTTAPWITAAVVLAFYGRLLGRGFTSEDFLLVRFLGENPPWRDLGALFGEPWLGISVVRFWRPVSTLLYGLEIAAFGAHPVGYNVVHVLLHAGNAVLVWAIARRLGRNLREPDEVSPLAAALLFAVYPLHPNAVIFGASFASLFSATFLLGTLLFLLRFRETGARSDQVVALALFVLGLGSYESAVVFPVVLAASDHLLMGRSDARRHRSLVPGYLPFFLLAGLYFLLRKSLLGVFLGGYAEQGRSLLSPQLGLLLHDLAASILWLHVPLYDWSPGPVALGVACLLLIAVPLAVVWRRGSLRLWLFAWIWIVASLAPFAFRPSVPANGRYWYLAAVGVVLGLTSLIRSRARSLAAEVLVLAGLFWAFLLHGYLGVYQEAGQTAREIQRQLVRSAGPGPSGMRFLTGHPDFLRNRTGVPVAQVLHYGLWDAVHPPFVQAAIPVYPLPPLHGLELLPILRGAPGSRIDEWDTQQEQIRPVAPLPAGEEPVELPVIESPAGFVQVRVRPGTDVRYRLIVLARGNPTVEDLGPGEVEGGILRAALPAEFCQTMDRLYGGEMFWWVEARDAAGAVSGYTRLRSFRMRSAA
ncbi:MAG TPA: hypothetical protein VEW48_17195 [Thermoanaerobaculia bacterium]|nr:hypothetical protein [Thermoanaerobaculia bacterium]